MKKLFHTFLFFLIYLIVSCSDKSHDDDNLETSASSSLSLQSKRYSVQNIFNTMPDYKEIIRLIEENSLQYNPDILHDPLKCKNYNTETAMALNLGIYGTDLSITRLFHQTQESITFLKSLNYLAQKLGIQTVFSDKLFDRLEQNKDIKDSSIQIMVSAFSEADKILTENKRSRTSSLMISGAWVEGFYISCQFAMEKNNLAIANAILNQNNSLNEILKMLELENLDESTQFIYDNLKTLKNVIEEQKNALNTNPDKVTEVIIPLNESILRIREKISKLN
ncbi:MAG: hypothetical protein N3F09_08140 [Bacteroidia bacterium]|nr:hypothetical protein [Bacteroidia bacterium]